MHSLATDEHANLERTSAPRSAGTLIEIEIHFIAFLETTLRTIDTLLDDASLERGR